MGREKIEVVVPRDEEEGAGDGADYGGPGRDGQNLDA